MYKQYRDRVEFYVVYIREAHPTDGWQVDANQRDRVLLTAARDAGQKLENASACVRNLGIEIPTLLDNMDNQAELAYTSWPDRLYLVDTAGKIAYKSGPGPRGFRPEELEAAIGKVVPPPAR
jgi:iodothyronine deiodinase-like protein